MPWLMITISPSGTRFRIRVFIVLENFLHTSEGLAEAQRMKEEGSRLYQTTHEVVLRPGVLGSLLGALDSTWCS